MKRCTVNTSLIPLKALYVFYYAGLSSFIPFKSIYQKQLGMSSGQNGMIQATMQLVSLFSPPVIGIITDKTKAYILILSLCTFFSVAFTVPFYFVSSVEREVLNGSYSCCHGGSNATGLVCPWLSNDTALISCGDYNTSNPVNLSTMSPGKCSVSDSMVQCQYVTKEDIYGPTFFSLVALTMLMSFFLSPVTPLVDASAMDIIGLARIKLYGVQRLWGAVGFGIVSLCVSYVTDVVSTGATEKNYLPSIISAAFFWFLTIVVTNTLKVKAPKAKSVLRGVGKLLREMKVLAFLVVVFMSGYGTGIQYSYLFWYVADLKNYSQTILGLSVLVTCSSEIPMFLISGWICEKLGYVSVLSLGLLTVAIRFVAYTFLTEAPQVLLIEGLHGISFALPLAAMCSHATVIAPKDAIATLISLSQAVYWGLGNMAGALFGGYMYQTMGGKNMFYVSAGMCALTSLLYWLLYGPLRFPRKTREKKDVKDSKSDKPEEELCIVEEHPMQSMS